MLLVMTNSRCSSSGSSELTCTSKPQGIWRMWGEVSRSIASALRATRGPEPEFEPSAAFGASASRIVNFEDPTRVNYTGEGTAIARSARRLFVTFQAGCPRPTTAAAWMSQDEFN